jgi:hypothetical protein
MLLEVAGKQNISHSNSMTGYFKTKTNTNKKAFWNDFGLKSGSDR